MEITDFNLNFLKNTLDLCSKLKLFDHHPCSYWGYDESILKNSIKRKDRKVLIGIKNNNVVSIGTITKGGPYQDHWAEIGVATHPSHRGGGLAIEMVKKLESLREELHIEFIKALILENNHPSRNLFERQGYKLKTTLLQDFKIDDLGNINDCVYYKFLA